MNREHARAILAHIDLIRHFAEGGDVGHRLINCRGEHVAVYPTDKINLGGLNTAGTYYVRVKPKLAWDKVLQRHVRHVRHWPEKIQPHEIMPCPEDEP
jgi:hypothetical protein